VKHDELAESTENAIFDEGERKKLKLNLDEVGRRHVLLLMHAGVLARLPCKCRHPNAGRDFARKTQVDPDYLDFAYTPIIQSGGKYDLRSSAVSTSDTLHAGTIVCSLGIRYKQYCSNVGRTYMVNPTNEQVKNYEFLLELQGRVLDAMKDGVQARDVYNKALAYVRNKRPDLEPRFPKNIGFGVRPRFLTKYTRAASIVRESLTVVRLPPRTLDGTRVSRGSKANEKEERNRTYAISIIDTVQIRGDTPLVLTDDETIEEDVKTEEKKKKQTKPTASPPKPTQVLASKTRSERAKAEEDKSAELKRRAHQQELAARKQAAGLARFSQEGTGGEIGGDKNQRQFRRFEAYKRETALPNEVRDLQIVVDHKNESVVLPIYGIPVPFHISTLKTTSKSDEGDYVYLRLNFVTPGQGAGKKDDQVNYVFSAAPPQVFEDSSATFIRSITYRSSDTYRINEIYKSITELKKAAGKKEAARKDMADIVEQDKLVDIKGVFPFLATFRQCACLWVSGVLTALPGGAPVPGRAADPQQRPAIRDADAGGQESCSTTFSDILFNNIRFMFFQPCDNELLVVLHMHLHNPVIIGKKKTKDVQFYREVSDAAFDETGNRRRKHHYGDEDELQAEQEERRRR
ncbi:MAG: FACT complex subunit-domain-containing protein, partial [Olpidium bornovanus]